MNDIKILNNFKHSWQIRSITQTLEKLDGGYKIGLIDSWFHEMSDNMEADLRQCVNYNTDVDLILYLRCDHSYDLVHNPKHIIDSPTTITNKPIFVIGHKIYEYYFPYLVIDYPIWFTITMQELHKQGVIYEINEKIHRSYIFSCLNSHTKEYRLNNLVYLFKNNLVSDTLLTFSCIDYRFGAENAMKRFKIDYPDNCEYFYQHIYNMLPITNQYIKSDEISMGQTIFDYKNAAYNDAYINIITETCYLNDYISEKIVKCFLSCQFFVAVSGKNTIQKLRDLGFDVFDDVINHEYDLIDDPRQRMETLHHELLRLKLLDWSRIYQDTTHRRRINKQKVINMDVETTFLNTLQEYISLVL